MAEIQAGSALGGGRYRLEIPLGAGGMATVWRAEDVRLGREVAVKVIADTLAFDPAYRARFEREARLAAGLSHPSVVRVFDYGAEGERPFLVMEYVEGGTLAERLERGAPPALGDLARDLLSALAHIHDAGIVHRDVKPANVLIDDRGRARLTDFGIAHAPEATRLTGAGHLVGTIRYLAPEISSGDPPTPRSDLYSCGVLLAEAGGPHQSAGEAAVIERLTRKHPQERPASADEALRILGGTAITVATAPTEVRVARPGRELHLTPRAIAYGVAVAAVAIVALILAGGDDDGRRATAAPETAPPEAPLRRQLESLDEQIRLLPAG